MARSENRLPHVAQCAAAHGLPIVTALDHFGNRSGQPSDIAGIGQHAVAAVPDGLGNARNARGHHGQCPPPSPRARPSAVPRQRGWASTKRSIFRSSAVTSRVKPVQVTCWPVGAALHGRRFRPAYAGDSNVPTARNCTGIPRLRRMAIASNRTSIPLRGRNRATTPSVQHPPGFGRCGIAATWGTPLGTTTIRSGS